MLPNFVHSEFHTAFSNTFKMELGQNHCEDSLECSHCEATGEISYATLQRQVKDIPVRVWVNNLPVGISENGVKNLFLTVGEPVSINIYHRSKSALVEFRKMNEVELAIRDLHGKPPYNLKVTLAKPKKETPPIQQEEDIPTQKIFAEVIQMKSSTDQNFEENLLDSQEYNKVAAEVRHRIKTTCKILGYNPSVRMRQKLLDFESDSKCISMGRGYHLMGDNDRFVGGLQKFEFSTTNSKAKDKVNFTCVNCQALTTKMCGQCLEPYCSKTCLEDSAMDHHKNIPNRCTEKISEESSLKPPFTDVELKRGSTVVLASYSTMQVVYLRPYEEKWKLKFKKLCNEVAVEVLRGNRLQQAPELQDIVIAKYYKDRCFYRAQVQAVSSDSITVLFIDFGNKQETLLEDLIPLPDHLKPCPGLAVRVQLMNVPELSSMNAVEYYNHLTIDKVPLLLDNISTDGVVLLDKSTSTIVNDQIRKYILPSWKTDNSAFSKLGEVFYLSSMRRHNLEVGKTYNFILSHFDEKEFLESDVLWVIDKDSDEYHHFRTEVLLGVTEYCETLKDDYYLPRTNELCLAKENGQWRRSVNLKSHNTTSCLFFLDDGHSSFVDTKNIRKMVKDLKEMPPIAVCCTLPDDPKLKNDKGFQADVVTYLKNSLGKIMKSVRVLALMGDAYCLSIPEIKTIAANYEV